MRKKKRFWALLLAMALVLSMFQGSAAEGKKKSVKAKVSSVRFKKVGRKLRLQKGKKFRLNTSVKVKPNKKKFKKLKFTSSNRKVVLVNSRGLLKGKKVGTAKITAASRVNPKKKATISVSVTKDVLVQSIQLNRSAIVVDEFNEKEIQLEVKKIVPSNAKNKEIEWSTDNEDVADVDDEGVVVTGDAGVAVITASAADKGGAVATCKVLVKENEDKDDGDDDEKDDVPDNVTPAPDVSVPPVPPMPPVESMQPLPPVESEQPLPPVESMQPVPPVKSEQPMPPLESEQPAPEKSKEPVLVTDIEISALAPRLTLGDKTQLTVSSQPSGVSPEDVLWTVDNQEVFVRSDGKLEIGENFSFGEDETEWGVVVTATLKDDPAVSDSIVLIVYDPDKAGASKLRHPVLDLSESQAARWALGSDFGSLLFTEDGTAKFNSESSSSVYNNGCAWYLNPDKGRTDVSDYEYVLVTVKISTDDLRYYKLMTWAGSDDSEFYWDKKDTWGAGLLSKVENQDGSYTFASRVSDVFQNTKTAKSIGIGLKSENEDGGFEARSAEVMKIEFSNSLPDGCTMDEPDEEIPVKLSSPQVSLGEEGSTSWTTSGEFGTVKFGEDGTVSFTNQPADPDHMIDAVNNGCGWYLDSAKRLVDVSAYKYVYIKADSDARVGLMAWAANSDPDGFYGGKMMDNPGVEIENSDGSKTLVYRTDVVFTNTEKARAVGFHLALGEAEPHEATVYEIGFCAAIPVKDDPGPSGTPAASSKPAPTPIAGNHYYFTDLMQPSISNANITAVTDKNGTPCTEIHFTEINQRAFFELPEDIDITQYDTASIQANVPDQLTFYLFGDTLDLSAESWWVEYTTFYQYPFYGGSKGEYGERNIGTQEYTVSENLGEYSGPSRYIAIGSNSKADYYGEENYLIYSVTLHSATEGVPDIVLESTDQDTIAPSTPKPPVDVIVPETDTYEIVIAEDNETKATKDKAAYRTDVVYGDGTVSYTNTEMYNSGMVFAAAPDGKRLDISDFDYIDVDFSGPASSKLVAFNNADSWWYKFEIYEKGGGSGRRTIRYRTSDLAAEGLNLNAVGGFAIGFNEENCIGATITVYSIRAVKEE